MRRVGGSSNSQPYHSEANDSRSALSDVPSQRSTRSSDSRFDALRRPRPANSELGSVVSGYAASSYRSVEPSESANTSRHTSVSGRDTRSVADSASSTATVDRLSEAGSHRSEASSSRSRYSTPSSSGSRSRIAATRGEFRPALPSVAEALSEAGSTLSAQNGLASLLDRLSMLPEEERERDPRFSELVSVVGSLLETRTQTPSVRRQPDSRASTTSSRQSTVVTTPASVAPSSQATGPARETRGIRNWPRHRHPFTADPDTLSLMPSESGRSHTETLERRIARRRRTRPHLASQIPRSTDS